MKHVIDRASKGGRARAEALTAEERADSARKAVSARWAKSRSTIAITASAGVPARTPTTYVAITHVSHDEPQVVKTGVASWNPNCHSYVITPKNQGESYTR